jgi:hypothetical protein
MCVCVFFLFSCRAVLSCGTGGGVHCDDKEDHQIPDHCKFVLRDMSVKARQGLLLVDALAKHRIKCL